jgi:phage gp29-like protein
MANQLQQLLSWINPFSRETDPKKIERDLRNYPAPVQLQRIRQDVASWREAITEAENVWYPHRVKIQKLYIDTINNGHVSACISRRKDLTLLRKWEFVDKSGKTDNRTTDLFLDTVKGQSQNKNWFNKFLNHGLDAEYFGYTLIALGNIENDAFPELDIVKRWNVSPDRLNVTNFTYSISGAPFMEGEAKKWHVYIPTVNEIGTSKCGYGLLYKIAIYEIFLRNLLGFNGDFVELFAQPYRVGKTTKTNEKERQTLYDALQQMGSAGFAMIDPEDIIEFIESKQSGTGYNSYDNFEGRLHKIISKIILGHADAIDSIPGRLGNSQKKSPAELALEDKQTKDGSSMSNIVNNQLMLNMRVLGFNIPNETVALLKNDAEIMETNNAIIDQAVKMQTAGLTMDAKYFTDQTGIPVSVPVIPAPPKFNDSIKDRLQKIYNHNGHNYTDKKLVSKTPEYKKV